MLWSRPTSNRVAIVPIFQLFLIHILVGSKRWGDALHYPLDPTRKGVQDNQKVGTTDTLWLLGHPIYCMRYTGRSHN